MVLKSIKFKFSNVVVSFFVYQMILKIILTIFFISRMMEKS